MTTTVDGTLGVFTPALTLTDTGVGTNALAPAATGTWTQTLPAGNGTLVLSTVTVNMPTTLGSSGDTLITDGAGNLSWTAPSSGLTVGTTAIASGTTGSLLINTSGVLQQIVMGGGVAGALAAAAGGAGGFALLNGSGVLPTSQGGVGGALNAAWTAILGAAPGTGVGAALGANTNGPNGLAVLNGSGLLPIAQGGTGLGSVAAAGETIISDGTNYVSGFPSQAANVTGGNAWEVVYQSATDTTAFVPAGTTDQLLASNTGAAPSWVNNSVKLGTTVVKVGDATATTVINDITTLKLTQDPTSGLEAATKQYVDAKTAGLQTIGYAEAATTGPITLSGPQTVDGVPLIATNTCLVKDQANPDLNGVYEVQAGPWTYISTANTWADYPSAVVFVSGGTANANTSWIQTNQDPAGTLGSTPQSWVIQSSPVTSYSPGTGISVLGSTITNTGVISFDGGSTGLSPTGAATGAITLAGTLAPTNGGTGNTSIGTGVQAALTNPLNAANGLVGYNGILGTSTQIAGSTSGNVTLQAQATASGTLTLPNGNASLVASNTAFTQGSVVFAGAGGLLSQNNAEFFWNDTNKQLLIGAPGATSATYQLVVDSNILVQGLTVGRGGGTPSDTSTAVGSGALGSTTGIDNTAFGYRALQNCSGSQSVGVGTFALQNNTRNGITGLGGGTLAFNTGVANVAVGYEALRGNTSGQNNTAVGWSACRNASTATDNVAVGTAALTLNGAGSTNIAIGSYTMYNCNGGSNNVAVGGGAVTSFVNPNRNTGVGVLAVAGGGGGTAVGSDNSGLGYSSVRTVTTGTQNVGVGAYALANITAGSNNAALGYNSGNDALVSITTQDNTVVLGNNSTTTLYCKTAVINTSDVRDKIVYGEVPHGLNFVNNLDTIVYNMRKERGSDEVGKGDKVHYGFSAQQVISLEGDKPVIIDNRNPDKLFFDGASLIPVLVNAIKELSAQVEELKKKG